MKYSSTIIVYAGVILLAACAGTVRVMNSGLGSGRIVSEPSGIDCAESCQFNFPRDSRITLFARPDGVSRFVGWRGDCAFAGSSDRCMLTLSRYISAEAAFVPSDTIPLLPDSLINFNGMARFLLDNPQVNSPSRLIAALRASRQRFADNWILMTRTESLQTGTAASPRVLLPSDDSRSIFAFSLESHPSFPHADPNKVEFIQFDTISNYFTFLEINMATRSIEYLPPGCAECHSYRPNWDAYDSWAGMVPYNRDRVYKGSLDAASLRYVFNLWGKRGEHRRILEQLNLPADMTRTPSGAFAGHVNFPRFDGSETVIMEPAAARSGTPAMPLATATARYPPEQDPTDIVQGGDFFRLYKTNFTNADEGRGVDLFDQLTVFNARRVAQILLTQPTTPVDVRPIALAIALGCPLETQVSAAVHTFLSARNRVANFEAMAANTQGRRQALSRLKSDAQRFNLEAPDGLIAVNGSQTQAGRSANIRRVRQEIFRRPVGPGFYSDSASLAISREDPAPNIARYRYFLEPFGVAVDKWSMSVHGRSRTYSFADLFGGYNTTIAERLKPALGIAPTVFTCTDQVRDRALIELSRPRVDAVPYSAVQGIFNRNCLECHGTFGGDGRPYAPSLLEGRSYTALTSGTDPLVIPRNVARSRLFERITAADFPMPPAYNGPPLSGADISVIERWIAQGAPRP